MKGKRLTQLGLILGLTLVIAGSSGCSLFKSSGCDCPSWSQENPDIQEDTVAKTKQSQEDDAS